MYEWHERYAHAQPVIRLRTFISGHREDDWEVVHAVHDKGLRRPRHAGQADGCSSASFGGHGETGQSHRLRRGLLDDQGQMKGSMLVLEFEGRSQLDEYLRNEPYVVEGVWHTIEVEVMNVVLLKGQRY